MTAAFFLSKGVVVLHTAGKFVVTEGSDSCHCCFENTVGTLNEAGELDDVFCETFNFVDAVRIAEALHKADS